MMMSTMTMKTVIDMTMVVVVAGRHRDEEGR
jgi:hypothetical protein